MLLLALLDRSQELLLFFAGSFLGRREVFAERSHYAFRVGLQFLDHLLRGDGRRAVLRELDEE